MSQPFTDEEMMVLAQLSYRNPYINVKGFKLSLNDMLDNEYKLLIEQLGEDKESIIEGIKKKTENQNYYIVASANDKYQTGFSAIAIEGPDSKTVTIACRGTEGFSFDHDSSRDVYADAELGFEVQTCQQKKMDEFMEQFDTYDSIYLTGHSLGGNLAVSGAIGYAHPEKIKGVVTFNCPGQNIDFLFVNAKKVDMLSKKIKNYQNEHDWVSDINNPIGEVLVIKSKHDSGDNHNQIGFDVSNGNRFNLVDGNKKERVHRLANVAINTFVQYLDKCTNLDIVLYAILKVVILVNFIQKKADKIEKWIKSNLVVGSVKEKTQLYSDISIDTYKLRTYAQRLQSVNRRISNLDGRLDSLYRQVGLLDLWNLMQADMLTGYCWRINRCVSYLNETAFDFENAESVLSNNI